MSKLIEDTLQFINNFENNDIKVKIIKEVFYNETREIQQIKNKEIMILENKLKEMEETKNKEILILENKLKEMEEKKNKEIKVLENKINSIQGSLKKNLIKKANIDIKNEEKIKIWNKSFKDFFCECVNITQNFRDKELISDVYGYYVNWFKDNVRGERPIKGELVEYMKNMDHTENIKIKYFTVYGMKFKDDDEVDA